MHDPLYHHSSAYNGKFLSRPLADRLISSGWSIRSVRVMLQVVGMLGPASCLLIAVSPLVGPSPSLASQVRHHAYARVRIHTHTKHTHSHTTRLTYIHTPNKHFDSLAP